MDKIIDRDLGHKLIDRLYDSGNLSLNSFAGAGNSTVYVAFKYTSSTTAASTWEVDNVKVTGNS